MTQLDFLRTTFPDRYTKLVEVGSGDGKLLDLLSQQGEMEIVGSDLPGHRLTQAAADYPHLKFQEADLIAMAKEHARPNTIFLAMNVLGNITEDDLVIFFRILQKRGAALVFSARDLALDTDMLYLDKGMAFAYNYKEIARRTNMVFFASLHRYQESGNQQGGIVATLVRQQQLKGSRVAVLEGRKLKKPATLRVRIHRLLRKYSLR